MIAQEKILFLANHILGKLFSVPKKAPSSILIVKLDEIGDVICALPAINALIAEYPMAKVDVLCKPYCRDIFDNLPGVHAVFTHENEWNKKYDWVAELRGTWGTFFKTFKFWPRARFSRGTVRLKNKGQQKHEIETNFEIFEPLELKASSHNYWPEGTGLVDDYIVKEKLDKFVVFHASARRVLRQWKPENFAKLSQWMYAEFNLKSVYIGVESEHKQNALIVDMVGEGAINASGVFDIPSLGQLMNKAQFFVGNESGPLQLADYLGLKSLSFFGPVVKDVFYPRTRGSRVLHHVLDCNPCDQIHCVQIKPCIDLIGLADAMAFIKEIK